MKSVVLKAPRTLEVELKDVPEPGKGECLLKVLYCGICGSDVHAYAGKHPFVVYPVTPGHEFSGTVVGRGKGVSETLQGARVCVEPSITCGTCPECLSGRYNICRNLRVLGFQSDGAMCEFITVPEKKVFALPENIDAREGALVEPAAVGLHAIRRSGLSGGEEVLVVGGGVIGLMITQAARSLGSKVTVVENSVERAVRAREFGADQSYIFEEFYQVISRKSKSFPCFPFVFECVGREETIDLAVRSAERGGKVIVVGVFPEPVRAPFALIQDNELDVSGSLMYTRGDFVEAVEKISSGVIMAREFVSAIYPLDEVEKAYEKALYYESNPLKIMLQIGG